MRKISGLCICLKFILFTGIFISAYTVTAQTPHIDSLLSVLKTQKEDTSKANTLFELTRAYLFELNDNQKVGEYGALELRLSQRLNFKKGIAYGYLNRAIFYRAAGDLDTAWVYDKKSLEVMIEIGNKRGESSCYSNLGLTLSHKGNYKEALEFMFKGLKMKQELGDKKGMSIAYNNIGNIYLTLANYSEALKCMLNALKIREELKDKIGISMAYNNIGNILTAQNKWEEGLVYYQKSLKIHEELSDQSGIGTANANIGGVYFNKKNYSQALVSYFKSMKAHELTDDKRGLAESYYNIGNVYLQEKNLKQALIYQLKSFHLYEKIGDKKGLAEAAGGVGNLYAANNEISSALKYYDLMLKLAQDIKFKDGIRNAYLDYALLYKKQRQFEKALEYTTLYNAIKDSILNTDNFKQVSELNTRYETDKKEKEILLLTKDQELNAKIIKQQKLVRWGLIGGVLLLFISIFSIYRRYCFKQKANDLLETQNKEIEEKNILITDSIDYAKTIQEAVFPTTAKIHGLFPQSFILNKPKSIVSGDFYWMNKIGNQLVCAVADCTGHGVPGAFMSLLGYNMLENEIKKNIVIEPALILDNLNSQLVKSLSKEDDEIVKHGMDISLISIDTTTLLLQYAGAHHPIYIIRDEQLTELKADKKGIGSIEKQGSKKYTHQSFQLQKNDMIYLHTDGFPDQIGGSNRKKFYYQPFKDLLIAICKLDMLAQKEKLDAAHIQWLGEKMDQTDDILIMGIRI